MRRTRALTSPFTDWKTEGSTEGALHNFALQKRRPVATSNDTRTLLEHGADVNAKSRNGDTPLLLAVLWSYRDEVVELLLNKGANVNARDLNGNTVFDAGISQNSRENVKLLLDHKAEVNAKNQTGDTAVAVDFCRWTYADCATAAERGRGCAGAQQRSANGFASCVQRRLCPG